MSGDVAVVTGASRGIGAACVRALLDRGLRVACLGRPSAHFDASMRSLPAERTLAVPCDVADEGAVAAAAKTVLGAFGVPRVVVANAGIVRRGAVHELDVAAWDEVIAVNLRGVFLTAHAFVGAMRAEGRGRFVAIASISATLGTAGASAYNASKWGVLGLVKSLAEELRGTGVQAIAVSPGSVDTDMLRGSRYAAQMTPEDVAKVVAFAALDAPAAMNGAALDVFGPLPSAYAADAAPSRGSVRCPARIRCLTTGS